MQPAQLLQLAESMAAKQLAEKYGVPEKSRQDAVLLHTAILQEQGRPDACAVMLQGPAGDTFVMPAERRSVIASLQVSNEGTPLYRLYYRYHVTPLFSFPTTVL